MSGFYADGRVSVISLYPESKPLPIAALEQLCPTPETLERVLARFSDAGMMPTISNGRLSEPRRAA